MVVERNLYPALPSIAVFIGVAVAALLTACRSRRSPIDRYLAIGVLVLGFGKPLFDTVAIDIAHTRRSTREKAQEWIAERYPLGSVILKERYTPGINRKIFRVVERRFAPYTPLDDLHRDVDYLVLAGHTYERWFEPNHAKVAHYDDFQRWYRHVFEDCERMAEFAPSRFRLGPVLRFYRIDPLEIVYARERHYEPHDVFLPGQWKLEPGATQVFYPSDRWSVVKGYFAAGRYRLTLDGGVAEPARLAIQDASNTAVATVGFYGGDSAPFELPRDDRYYFRLELGAKSFFRGVRIGPPEEAPGKPEPAAHRN